MVGEIRRVHWTRDWVMSSQPVGRMDYEILQRDSGEWVMLNLWEERNVVSASQIVSQEFA